MDEVVSPAVAVEDEFKRAWLSALEVDADEWRTYRIHALKRRIIEVSGPDADLLLDELEALWKKRVERSMAIGEAIEAVRRQFVDRPMETQPSSTAPIASVEWSVLARPLRAISGAGRSGRHTETAADEGTNRVPHARQGDRSGSRRQIAAGATCMTHVCSPESHFARWAAGEEAPPRQHGSVPSPEVGGIDTIGLAEGNLPSRHTRVGFWSAQARKGGFKTVKRAAAWLH